MKLINLQTPTAMNFQMSYAPATIYAPAPGSYSFETPSLQPLPPYPGISSFLGHHDLQLPYANMQSYQQLSAAPLSSSEEQFYSQAEYVQSLSFEPIGQLSDHLGGLSPESVGFKEEQTVLPLKLEPSASSRVPEPASH
jgi:hypothetical protein